MSKLKLCCGCDKAWAGLCGHIAPTIRLTLCPKSAKSENNKLWLACIFGPQDCEKRVSKPRLTTSGMKRLVRSGCLTDPCPKLPRGKARDDWASIAPRERHHEIKFTLFYTSITSILLAHLIFLFLPLNFDFAVLLPKIEIIPA